MKLQRGGFAVGLIVGLLVGLVLALGVALYVTKVPVPFVNKVPQRSAEQDAAEAERNKNWDPNAPLSVKVAPRGVAPASPGLAAPSAATRATPRTPPPPGLNAVAAPTAPTAAPNVPPSAALASAPAKALKPGTDPYAYFAQAGAYSRAEDAQAQRAKLALIGLDAKIVEREQSGRTVYRVRLGPFEKRPDAEAMLERLNSASVESSLVRVERQ
jgi:cell division protein FtsN